MRFSQSGARLLNNLFNIRPGEGPRLAILYSMYFVALTGINWGEPIVEAAFLEQIGLKFLPWAFVANAIFSILAIAVYTAFADRTSNTTLLIAILGISVAGIIAGLVLLGWGLVFFTYPLLYLILNVPLLDIFNVHWATYVNSFYDTQSAKRIIPVLGSGARVAGIVAGLTLPLLNTVLAPGGIIFIWLTTLVIMALLAWLMPSLLKRSKPADEPRFVSPQPATDPARQTASYLDNVRDGFRYVTRSSFLRWMAVSTFLVFILFKLISFQAFEIMEAELQTTENISNFIAILNGIGNLVALPIQLFLINRLISRVGLGNASLTFPFGTLAVCGALVASPTLPTAALAYVDRTTFRTTFRNPIDSLLYNAVPLRVKGRARAFIGGLIVPVGGLIGGLLLLIPTVSSAWLLPALIGILAVAYPITALVVRKHYTQALIEMLEQEDFSFLLAHSPSNIIAADPATLNMLKKKLDEGKSHEFTLFMAQLISQIGDKEAVPILAEAAKTAKEGRLRAAIINTLIAAEVSGQAVQELYTDFLADPDSQVRQVALAGLEQLIGPEDEQFRSMALGMLSDADSKVRIRVLAALAHANDFYELRPAMNALEQLLADSDPYLHAQGVRILGQVGYSQARSSPAGSLRAVQTLANHLVDSEDEVRLAAAMAIEKLSKTKMSDQAAKLVLKQIPRLLDDPVERIRQAAIDALGAQWPQMQAQNESGESSHQAIVAALTDSSLQVRTTAVEAMVQVGKSIIPFIHPLLASPELQLRKMAAVILSRVNRREFGDLIKSHITSNLLTIYQNYGRIAALTVYADYPSLAVLQSALYEENEALVDEIFYLLAAVHDPDSLKIITESLESDSVRTRANAVEALEALTTPQTAQLIAPLFEPEPKPERLLELSRETWDMHPPDAVQVIKEIMTGSNAPWLRAIMTFALGEIGASLSDEEKKKEEPPARRRPPADLLGMLIDSPEETGSPAPAKSPERISRPKSASRFPLTLEEIETLLATATADPVADVRSAAEAAKMMLAGVGPTETVEKEGVLLSTIERIIFLKEVPFFEGMTINQLQVLATICEEELFEEDQLIFNQSDPGGALYVIVTGRVGIEQEKRQGSFARLATLEAHSYFGEMTLFDNGPRSAAAIALQDTLTLRLRREPLIALARQYPDLSLELINVLSERLRQANNRIAELTRTRPRQLQKLFDALD